MDEHSYGEVINELAEDIKALNRKLRDADATIRTQRRALLRQKVELDTYRKQARLYATHCAELQSHLDDCEGR